MCQLDQQIIRRKGPNRLPFYVTVALFIALLAGCVPLTPTTYVNHEMPLVVFGAYGTSIDEPWNQAIHRALLAAQNAGDIRYTYIDQIGFTGEIDQVLRTAIAENTPAIMIGDAFGNEATVAAVAQEYPEIAFVFGSDEGPRAPNLSVFDSWTHEAAYLAGMLAGGLTKSNRVGVVAGYPEGSVNRVINAFIAGVQASNPEAEVQTTFINSWFDPVAAATAAQAQINAGTDVIFGERTGVSEAAASAGVYVIGNMIDQTADAPALVASSVVWNMRPTIDYVIDQVRNGDYTAQDLADFGTLAMGGAQLAPLNQALAGGIPENLAAQIEAQVTEISGGHFVVPINDRKPPASTQNIMLGALYNFTGAQSGLDIPSAQGTQLAVDEINRAGGVLGQSVHLILEDGETDGVVLAAKTAQILTDYPNVTAFLGLSDTDMVLGAAPVAAAAQRIFLTSGATSPQLPEQVPGYLFLACFGDNVQAAAAAEWAYDELSARSVAILYDAAMLYTQGLEHYFTVRFTELGGAISSTQSYMTGDRTSLRQAVDKLAAADIIFVAAGPEDAPEAARLLRTTGFTMPILGGDGLDSGALWQQYAELDNIYFTTHAYLGADNPNPTVQAFRRVYGAAYPDAEPDAFTALGYDAANLLMTAIRNAESAEPEAVRAALATIQAFDGVTGRISFTPGNPIPSKSVTILAVEQGAYRYITEVIPASVPVPEVVEAVDADPIKAAATNCLPIGDGSCSGLKADHEGFIFLERPKTFAARCWSNAGGSGALRLLC